METVIAEKYAVALLQVAKEKKSVDSLASEMQAVQKLLENSPELKATLEHPRVKAQEKLDALQALLGGTLSATLENFLRLLLTKKRIKHLKAVTDHFERLCYEMRGKTMARVLTAMPLTPDQKKNLVSETVPDDRPDRRIEGRSQAGPHRRHDDLHGRPALGRERPGPAGKNEAKADAGRDRLNLFNRNAEVTPWLSKRMK